MPAHEFKPIEEKLVHTDAELRAVQNLPRLDYRKTHNFNSLEGSHNGIAAVC